MRHKSVSEYVATLSEEERKQFKGLIDESLQREKEIKENRTGALNNLEKLKQNMSLLNTEFNNMVVQLNNLHDALKALSSKLDENKKPVVKEFSPPKKEFIPE